MEVLSVSIKGKESTVFESKCLSVSMANRLGQFDILPEHANFVSTFSGNITVRKVSESAQEVFCSKGLVKVENNNVEIVILEE